MRHKLHLLEGSSIDPAVADQIFAHAEGYEKIMVFLDSNHTHDHVLEELKLYAPLTSKGSYCVVWDTGVEDLPADMCGDRPWGKGDNPKTAVWDYLKTHPEFEIDTSIPDKLQITVAHDGFLKRVL